MRKRQIAELVSILVIIFYLNTDFIQSKRLCRRQKRTIAKARRLRVIKPFFAVLTENDPKNVHMFRSGFIVTNHWKGQVGVRFLVCDEHGDKKVASSLFNGQVVSAD